MHDYYKIVNQNEKVFIEITENIPEATLVVGDVFGAFDSEEEAREQMTKFLDAVFRHDPGGHQDFGLELYAESARMSALPRDEQEEVDDLYLDTSIPHPEPRNRAR